MALGIQVSLAVKSREEVLVWHSWLCFGAGPNQREDKNNQIKAVDPIVPHIHECYATHLPPLRNKIRVVFNGGGPRLLLHMSGDDGVIGMIPFKSHV